MEDEYIALTIMENVHMYTATPHVFVPEICRVVLHDTSCFMHVHTRSMWGDVTHVLVQVGVYECLNYVSIASTMWLKWPVMWTSKIVHGQ